MTDHQELVLVSFVGPAVLAAAGFCLAVNVSNRAGTALGALGALVGLIGMFIVPEEK